MLCIVKKYVNLPLQVVTLVFLKSILIPDLRNKQNFYSYINIKNARRILKTDGNVVNAWLMSNHPLRRTETANLEDILRICHITVHLVLQH